MGDEISRSEKSQNHSPDNGPEQEKQHHRIEAKAYLFLASWVFADLLVVFERIHVAALVLYAVIVAFLGFGTYHAIKGWPPRKKTFCWVYASSCVALSVVILVVSQPKESPVPHLKLILNTGDSHETEVFLTNDFLLLQRFMLTSNQVGGFPTFNGNAVGCIVIPIQPGASNIVFNFTAENDSPAAFTDLQAAIAVPKSSTWSINPQWQNIEPSIIIPELARRLEITNLQAWGKQSAWVVRPYDRIGISMTNSSIPMWNSPKMKGDFILIDFRSTGFENMLAANLIFVPGSSNFSKPYVMQASFNPDGTINIPFPFPVSPTN
jgi:hypothetical protein